MAGLVKLRCGIWASHEGLLRADFDDLILELASSLRKWVEGVVHHRQRGNRHRHAFQRDL